jgi:Family of unknown function (DUF5995)
MSAAVPAQPLQLARIEEAKNIDDVLRNLDQVIEWSIRAQDCIGYFAVMYKRVTLAVRAAIDEGQFDDGPMMEHFDAAFAQHYFDALNGYFYPGEYNGLTLSWEVAFIGHQDAQATMVQQMMSALNAHICFDLGVATAARAGNALQKFEHDFNVINAVIATQIPGMLDVVQQLSPELRRIRRVIPDEVGLIKRVVMKMRNAAWLFAIDMALHPASAREKRVNQAAWTAALSAWYLAPPAKFTPFPLAVRAIAKRESRDVAANIRALDGISHRPEKRFQPYL